MTENSEYFGQVHILDIGLHKDFYESLKTTYELVDEKMIHDIYKPRDPFAHKGKYGHALLVAGGYGKMGAAVLAAQACLHSGVGLLTCHIPKSGYEIMQRTVPEAMVTTDLNTSFIAKIENDLSKYDTVGIGPGIGTGSETRIAIKDLLAAYKKPIVIDADGLNCVSMEKDLLASLPPHSILTPHPKEFERLFGESKNDFERIEKALENARSINCIIVLKGHYTFIATPSGHGYFNNTGNAGMAKGGSGDVLTGILTSLLAQGYPSEHAAILGVYLHGLAGDIASEKLSQEAMVAGNIIENLGEAFKIISHSSNK
jgi:NAD(P)H-hydrate epimerase